MPTTYGVTDSGFVPKRLADIADSLKTRLNGITDSKGNTISVDLEDSTLLSQLIMLNAEALSECWEAASAVATQFDPRYAVGPFLSGVVQLNGLFRKDPTPTVINITLYGTAGTVISAGKLIATSDNEHTFRIDSDYIVGVGGSVTGTATSTEKTVVVVADSSSMNIQSPIVGWTNVVCNSTAVDGISQETDEELRIRQQLSTQATAQRESEAIESSVREVDGVEFVKMYENPTTSTDGKGIPAGSICVIVKGGTDLDVATAIYNKMACMTQTYGSTTETFDLVDVKFQRPSDTAIYINVEVKAKTGFPRTDYEMLVKDAIIAFVSAAATGYVPGQTVFASELICPVNAVRGLAVTLLEVSDDNVTYASSVEIEWNKIATFSAVTITVTEAT